MAPEVAAKITVLRQKMIEGTATLDELKEAVVLMRSDRKIAASTPSGSKKSSAKPKAVVNADDMLNELNN